MNLSKEQCNHIKGLGILLIMLHNYVDILLGIGSNEVRFSQEAVDIFQAHVFTADFLWYILSYAGWIGVPVFFFLSGYGLTKKYPDTQRLAPGPYIKNHLIKLWLLLIPVYLVYYAIYRTNIKSAIAQITFTNTILSYGKNGIYIDPGVYWFFGAILQFYLLFLVFRKLSNRWLWVLCGGFVVLHYLILYGVSPETMNWTRNNFLGWGEIFILGILAARSGFSVSKRLNAVACAVSLAALCVCLVTKWLTPLVELFTVVFFITLTGMVRFKWVGFIGIISSSVFVIHPLVRMLFYSIYFAPEHPYITTLIYTVIVLVVSWIHYRMLKWFNKMVFSRRYNNS